MEEKTGAVETAPISQSKYSQNLSHEQIERLRALEGMRSIGLDDAEEVERLNLIALRDAVTEVYPERIAARMIDLTCPPPENSFCLMQGNVGCFPSGDIVVIGGKAKKGKTQTEIVFSTALLKGQFMGFKAVRPGMKVVVYLDLEQNPINTAKFAQKVHRLCGWNPHQNHPRFMALNLRGDDPPERAKLVEESIVALKPDVVFIDGAKDMLTDINDPNQSANVLNLVMRLTKEHPVCLATVIHENKNDQNLRGHIGTELLNKASEVWRTKSTNDIFDVEQTECRNRPCENFSFRIDRETGLLMEAESVPTMTSAQKADFKLRENLRLALPPLKSLTYTELKAVYMEVGACARTTAENHITKALKWGYVTRDDSGYYRLALAQPEP